MSRASRREERLDASEAAPAAQAGIITVAAATRVAVLTAVFGGLVLVWPAQQFGAFMFAYVLANALAKIVDFGFVLQLNRDVARREADAAPIAGSAFWVKVCLVAPLAILAGALNWLRPVAEVREVFALLLASEVAQSFALFFAFPLRGLGRYAAEAGATILAGVALAAAVTLALLLEPSPESAAAGMLTGRLLGAIVTAAVLTRHIGRGWMVRPDRRQLIAGLRTGLPFGVHVSVGALCLQMETLVLHWVLGPAATGVYQVGARLVSVALMAGDAVHTVYLRRIARSDGDPALLSHLMRILFVMGVAAAAIFTGAANGWTLQILGDDYLVLRHVLPVLGLLVLVRFLGIPYGLSLTLGDRQSARATAVVVMALLGSLLGYLIIDRIGIVGAAVGAVINSTLLYALYAALLGASHGSVLNRHLARQAPILAMIAVVIAVAAALGDGVRLLAGVILGAAALVLAGLRITALRIDARTARNALWRGIELLLTPLATAAWLMPRDRRLWVFGSWNGTRFADNPRYLFEHLSTEAPRGVRAVWISRRREIVRIVTERGGEAYSWLSPRGLWIALRAGVYVFDSRVGDVNRVTVGRAQRVNLWHGVPLKKIEADITNASHPLRRARASRGLKRLAWRLARPEFFERYDWILAPSESVATCLASAFEMDRTRVIVGPYPRGDGFCDRSGESGVQPTDAVARRLTFLYAPTFRDAGNSAAQPIPIDWDDLDRLLSTYAATLLVKLHPVDRRLVPEAAAYRSIRFLPADDDIYATLRGTDVLITDYSSVYFDFLLLDRPMLFYAYDLDRYTASSRGLYFDYQGITPGPVATDYASLTRAVAQLLEDFPGAAAAWGPERARVRNVIHSYAEPPFSSRTAAKLQEALLAPAVGEAA